MSGVSETLNQYGISFSEARDFIYANLSWPELIYDTALQYDVTFSMIAELYGQNVTTEQVIAFFSSFGLDTTDQRLNDTPDTTQLLASKSYQITEVSDLASRESLYVSAIETAETWSGNYVFYSFPTSIPDSHSISRDTAYGWRALTQTEQTYFRGAVEFMNAYIDVEVAEAPSLLSGDIQVAAIRQTTAEAFAYFPGLDIGGDIFLNRDGGDEYYYTDGGYGVYTMTHELGHAMGLDHTFEGEVLATSVDNTYYSAMSYTLVGGYEVEALDSGGRYSTYTVDAYRTELGIIDVAALQAMYGADMSTNRDDTVYVYDEDSRSFETSTGHYHTIWDAGGEDTLDLSDAAYASVVNLNDYTLSSISERSAYQEAVEVAEDAGLGTSNEVNFIEEFIESLGDEAFLNHNNLGIALGVVIENVIAGTANDVITDNEVDNQIFTGGGQDVVYLGAGGYDYVDGGAGDDTVVLDVALLEVDRYVDSEGYHIIADDFSATLVGVETVQYSDVMESIG